MNNFCKVLAVYAAVSCAAGDRVQAISASDAHSLANVAIKIGILATFIWGAKSLSDISAILADMRDMQFEQLMNNVCGTNIPSDNINVSYEQEASEQVFQTIDSLERNTEVSTNIYVQLPTIRLEYIEEAEIVEDDDSDEDDEDDHEQCFDDCCE
jgi:hypothetical protein